MIKHEQITMKTITNSTFLTYFLTALFLVLFGTQIQTSNAQSVDIGADFVNRYVWRGFDFGNSASIQPYIEFSSGGFTLGTWASYATSPVNNNLTSALGAAEHDLYASYSFGAVSIGITDYYFPVGSEFFNYDNDGDGAHIIEPNISITGGESFPVTIYGAINAYNDSDNSIYLEASVPFSVGETDLGIALGVIPQSSAYYGTNDAAVTNLNLSASREIKITESFSLPLFASYILNPYLEQSHLVFGLSL